MKELIRFLREEDGVVSIEYGLIAAGIAIAIVATVGLVGDELVTLFNTIITHLGGTVAA
jgi:pilus assembly protein Flp/PilA